MQRFKTTKSHPPLSKLQPALVVHGVVVGYDWIDGLCFYPLRWWRHALPGAVRKNFITKSLTF